MTSKKKLTYSQAGVDYSCIDPIKVLAQKAARATAHHIAEAGFPEIEASRGESAYVVDAGRFYLASITECLGTKVLVADLVSRITGRTHFDSLAQDTLGFRGIQDHFGPLQPRSVAQIEGHWIEHLSPPCLRLRCTAFWRRAGTWFRPGAVHM